jgi:anti-sigma regulatory factor (Ser/Thr protein kinase)
LKIDTRRYPARVDDLPAVTEFVAGCADRFGLDGRAKFGLLLALEEAFVNICRYAYGGAAGVAEVSCESEGDAFVLAIFDWGKPFDMLSLPEPDTSGDLEHRPLGGLGVHFIRKFSNTVTYRRDDDRNILRLVFRSGARDRSGEHEEKRMGRRTGGSP